MRFKRGDLVQWEMDAYPSGESNLGQWLINRGYPLGVLVVAKVEWDGAVHVEEFGKPGLLFHSGKSIREGPYSTWAEGHFKKVPPFVAKVCRIINKKKA